MHTFTVWAVLISQCVGIHQLPIGSQRFRKRRTNPTGDSVPRLVGTWRHFRSKYLPYLALLGDPGRRGSWPLCFTHFDSSFPPIHPARSLALLLSLLLLPSSSPANLFTPSDLRFHKIRHPFSPLSSLLLLVVVLFQILTHYLAYSPFLFCTLSFRPPPIKSPRTRSSRCRTLFEH